jgi:hypothetical protein
MRDRLRDARGLDQPGADRREAARKCGAAGESAEALHGREACADLLEVGNGAGNFHSLLCNTK